jgi:hypothetical protein
MPVVQPVRNARHLRRTPPRHRHARHSSDLPRLPRLHALPGLRRTAAEVLTMTARATHESMRATHKIAVWTPRIITAAAIVGLLLALTHSAPWTTTRWMIGPWALWAGAQIVLGMAEGPSPAQIRLERRAMKQVAYERAVERARRR